MNSSIAIIGATGLLGRELVAELKNIYSNNEIYLLIRAKTEEHKTQRFELLMRWIFGDDTQQWQGRIFAIKADLDQEGLNISADDLNKIAKVSDFFCLASSTSFCMSISKARKANVASLENLMSLISSQIDRQSFRCLHYVSTAFVANNQSDVAYEVPVDLSRSHRNTYEQSKAEAENQLSLSELPYRIYRPSIILGSSKNGRAANYATIYVALKAAYEGILPFFPCGPEVRMDIVSSDYVASVIALISKSETQEQIFNICSGKKPTTVGEIYDLYSEFSEQYFKGKRDNHFPPMRFFDRSFTRHVLSGNRKFVAKKLRIGLQKLSVMLPFLTNDVQRFDNSATLRLTKMAAPEFRSYAEKIFEYAIEDNFGEPKVVINQPKVSADAFANNEINNITANNPLIDKLISQTKQYGHCSALVDPNNTMTYLELVNSLLGVSKELHENHVYRGATAILKVDNTIDSVVLMLACCHLEIQSILLPKDGSQYSQNLNLLNQNTTAEFELTFNQGKLQVTQHHEFSRQVGPTTRKNEIVIATSGTTGKPKLVRHNYDSIMYSADKVAWAAGLKNGDRLLLSMPIFHAFAGVIALPSAFSVGACIIFSEQDGLEAIAEFKATHYVGVTAHFESMLAQENVAKNLNLSHWVVGLCGDDYLSPEIRESFERTYMRPLTQGYGLSEALVVSIIPGNDPRHENSVGKAIPGVEVKVIDEQSRPVEIGEVGELCVRGNTLMSGYLDEANSAYLDDGFIKTGDLGSVDSQGYIYISGRKQCAAGGYTEVLKKDGKIFSSALIGDQLSLSNPDSKIQVFFGDNKAFVFSDNIENQLATKSQELFRQIDIGFELIEVKHWPRTPVGKINRQKLSQFISNPEIEQIQ